MSTVEGSRVGQELVSSNRRYFKFTSAIIAVIILSTFAAVVSEEIPTASAEVFGPNIRVDDAGADSSSQYSPSIAISQDGRMFIAWTDTRSDIYGDIYATTSLDAGKSFLGNVKINDDTSPAKQGHMDVTTDSAGDVHAVWMDWRNDADGASVPGGGVDGMDNVTVYYSNSMDDGRSWSPNLMLSNNSTGYYDWIPHIAVDVNDSIHVVWESSRGLVGTRYILYSRSEDCGNSFSNPRRIDKSTGSSQNPSIAIDENGVLYVVWEDNRNATTGKDVWFAQSTDGGSTFEGHKRVNNDQSPVPQGWPRISAQNGIIGVVWYDEFTLRNISFSASFDEGDSFTNATTVNDDTSPMPRDCPSLWINESGYISVAWMTKRNGNEDIYFASSTDGGQSFSTNQRVNDDAGTEFQRIVDIAMDSNGYVYLVWMDSRERGDFDIYFTRAPPEIADLEAIDFSFNPPSPVTEWTVINLNTTIRNNGDRETTDVLVRFFDGDPSFNVQIGLDQILPRVDANGGIGHAETQWIATPGGAH
ncbi:MAG: exo-alpha-sialidase, partial [Thermoplasmata archaeon]|nr:exo-alpha-sialidase [Thermoplasmata archaeon]